MIKAYIPKKRKTVEIPSRRLVGILKNHHKAVFKDSKGKFISAEVAYNRLPDELNVTGFSI